MNKRDVAKFRKTNAKLKIAMEGLSTAVHAMGDKIIKYATEYLPHYQAGFRDGILHERRRVRKAKKKAGKK